MKKLYSFVITDDEKKSDLYIRDFVLDNDSNNGLNNGISVEKNKDVDFFTYFNSFSIAQWKRYTTIEELVVKIKVQGTFQIKIMIDDNDSVIISETFSNNYKKTIPIKVLHGNVIGISLKALSDEARFLEGTYYGRFANWNEKKVGVSICTFKRETYVLRTIEKLIDFQKANDWLNIIIVDNASTLALKKSKNFEILHNPNFGGSGGFTRGIIEYIDRGEVDYILLMDDDINIEVSALERMYALLCGLKDEYMSYFIGGAMLSMEQPTIQHEDTAYWNKFISKVHGHGRDLAIVSEIVKNVGEKGLINQYAGWWWCCMPVKRIKELGYPLPVFIKSDDMEYGIRNEKEIITMNGIAVWHETFLKKMNSVIRYYSDRNSFILNHYVRDCNRFTLLLAILGRMIKRLSRFDIKGLWWLNLALEEYLKGMEYIVQMPSDDHFAMIKSYKENKFSMVKLGVNTLKSIFWYSKTDREYKSFRDNRLKDNIFWKQFLGL